MCIHLCVYSRTLYGQLLHHLKVTNKERIDIPYPGNKGEIQDGRQDGRDY